MSAKVDLSRFTRNIQHPYCGCPLDADSDYDKTTGLVLSSDYSPFDTYGFIRGVIVGSSGHLDLVMANGGELVIDVVVAASDYVEVLHGAMILTIKSTTTCGNVQPMF